MGNQEHSISKIPDSLNLGLNEYKLAIDESTIIAVTDQQGTILEVNRKFCELTKYSKEELIGQDHRIINSGYHPKEFFKEMWRTIASGKVWRGEIRNKTKEGKLYWVHTTIVPFLNEKKKPYRYISIRVDITEQKEMEVKLHQALKDNFNQTVKNMENGIFKMIKDEQGKLIYTLSAGKLMDHLGIGSEVLKNHTPHEIFPEVIASFKQSQYEKAFRGQRINYEIEQSGRLVYVDVSPIKQGDTVIELLGSVHDVTELRATQRKLEENQILYKSLFQLSQDVVFTFDTNGQLQTINPAAEKLLGYSSKEIAKKPILDFVVKEYQTQTLQSFVKALEGDLQNFDSAVYNQEGEEVHLNLTLLPVIVDKNITVIYTVGKDISEHKKIQKLNAYFAYHDELTKLLNRRGIEARLKEHLEAARLNQHQLAVMYIDLDRFKHVNDTLGHFIGDRLLEKVAARLQEEAGERMTIARMGGDEFMILCPSLAKGQEYIHFVEELLDSINKPFFIEEYELYVTASIGISSYPNDGDNVVDLMKHADVALYRAKDQGRNNYQIYSASMDATSYQSFFMERDLRKAVKQEEFVMHLQPRVDIQTKKIVGAEALIRWNHPGLGLIPPNEFIPLAEETGLINPMGTWMKKKVCELLKEWREAGIPLIPIGINISALRFLQKDFVQSVKGLLTEYELDGSLLELEITENSLMKNEDIVKQTIAELQAMGIKIYIDDFGTGYSSFSYLKSYNLDGIKIDQSFIRGISRGSENAGISEAMIQMAKILGMDVIAEGVETEAELQFLCENQCRYVQGYLFGKPVAVEEFECNLAVKW